MLDFYFTQRTYLFLHKTETNNRGRSRNLVDLSVGKNRGHTIAAYGGHHTLSHNFTTAVLKKPVAEMRGGAPSQFIFFLFHAVFGKNL